MKYYVMSDIHGFFKEMQIALEKAGYFEDKEPHKIIICGDLFDRGFEALLLQDFVLDLMRKDQIILIKGNHEELATSMLNYWHRSSFLESRHVANGTVETFLQLTGVSSVGDFCEQTMETYHLAKNTPYIKEIIPNMLNYFETNRYVFVHGWIPCEKIELGDNKKKYLPIEDWRNASDKEWSKSRWTNGMEAHFQGVKEIGKTVVCGHHHCSFGHSHYERKCGEFDFDADFTPYFADGIIAIDACTVKSGFVNCLVIED